MWVVERMAYFTLIRDKGAVYTVQATYVATPAAVVIAAAYFRRHAGCLALGVARLADGGALPQQHRARHHASRPHSRPLDFGIFKIAGDGNVVLGKPMSLSFGR